MAYTWEYVRPSPQLLSPGTMLGSLFIYLFIYLFQQTKTTLKSTGHEIYISVKKAFTIFAILPFTKASWRFSRQSFFLILWLDNVILQQLEKISNSVCSNHNARGCQGLRYFSFFSMKAEGLRKWKGGGGGNQKLLGYNNWVRKVTLIYHRTTI